MQVVENTAPMVDLAGTWSVRDDRGSVQVDVQIPGDLHSALIESGEIADPYVGRQEDDVQWVGERGWAFERKFDVSEALLRERSVYLNMDWVDTIAEVYVNGKHVLSAKNMFKRYRVDVKDVLKVGENEIRVVIAAAGEEALKLAKQMPKEVPWAKGNNRVPHMNMVRKVQCHAGWDWGICLLVLGMYGDVSLHGCDGYRVEHVNTTQKHGKGMCKVGVKVEVLSDVECEQMLRIELGGEVVEKKVRLREGVNEVESEVEVLEPRLWWPAGQGEQTLYDLKVMLGHEVCEKRIGLREVEWITREDHIGKSMTLRVNGRDVFCKGANWIPVDALPSGHTDDVYRELLEDAVDANMNMIRVWGGGQYEHDVFYELCDEMGLMVWQDMMFSCSLYPATKEFLAEIKDEAEYQIKRLCDHASLVLWCGDNELIGFMNGIFRLDAGQRDRFLVQYDRLNQTLRSAVDSCDGTRTFWPSSPCNGDDDFGDAWHEDGSGDMHYWNVWHEGKAFEDYYNVVPRFCSEFGYQSFNSLSVVEGFVGEEERNVTSPTMEHHQRHNGGNGKIVAMMTRYFRMPSSFESMLYLSQVQQALAIKTAVEFWRHMQPICMGTLYWQLNDVWPVASWSSIEYGGKWKQLQYHAKRFHAPAMIAAFAKGDDVVEVWGVSDKAEKQSYVAEFVVYDFDGNEEKRFSKDVVFTGQESVKIADLSTKRMMIDPSKQFMRLQLFEKQGRGEEKQLVHENTYFFGKFKECELAKAEVQWSIVDCGGELAVELQTDKPAFFVHVDAGNLKGSFDDSSVTLMPSEKRLLFFRNRENVTAKALTEALSVMHLRETY
ncbi:glycoside hydrolase family 2 protein [Planctomycetota bacterium]|nr:glycoside hydrolase family 2 protein [Planctomycetota bacterium]